MDRRNFLKSVLAVSGAALLPINSVFALPTVVGIDASKKIMWRNYYFNYKQGSIPKELKVALDKAFKDFDWTQDD